MSRATWRESAPPPSVPARRGGGFSRLVVMGLIALLAYAWLKLGNPPEPVLASVRAESEVTVSRADAGTDETLSGGEIATLQRGDSLTTVGSGGALFVAGEGEVVLGGDTELLVLELQKRPLLGGLNVTLALQRGEIEADMGALGLGGSFVLETDVVTIEGRAFRCRINAERLVTVESFAGAVQVRQGEESVSLARGQGATAALGEPLRVEGEPDLAPTRTRRVRTATLSIVDLDKTLFPVRTVEGAGTPESDPGASAGSYVVQEGDTLYSIAQEHGLSWEAIWEANQDTLDSPDTLHEGQVLRIPAR